MTTFSRRTFTRSTLFGIPAFLATRSAFSPATGEAERRFLFVFVSGGWDSSLGTDPLVGSKRQSTAYDSRARERPVTTVTGKSRLQVGAGLAAAAPGFARINTAFINGMATNILAHATGYPYLLSARESNSRSSGHPAITALLAADAPFPAHVVIGHPIPLGDTLLKDPPLVAGSAHDLHLLLARTPGLPTERGNLAANAMVGGLDRSFAQAVGPRAPALSIWDTSRPKLDALYRAGLSDKLAVTTENLRRYAPEGEAGADAQSLASAVLVLKSGLSRIVTVTVGGALDTHLSHFPLHEKFFNNVSFGLNTLIEDLCTTPDPEIPEASLAETTTVLVVSEFVRTPGVNLNDGTDHWPSVSAILMGRGVRDDVVVGGTDDLANPLGWNGERTVERTDATTFRPEHLLASVVRHMGEPQVADTLSTVHRAELFT